MEVTMSFDRVYHPNKLRNKAVEEICFDIYYMRQYYDRSDLELYDCSNTSLLKIDLQDSMCAYINDDQTADICEWGPGMSRNVPLQDTICQFLKR